MKTKKNIWIFLNTCVESPIAVKQHLMAAGSQIFAAAQKLFNPSSNRNIITDFDMRKICTEAGSSPLRSTLNTNVITGLGMCTVCTEAVHCVAL